MCLKFALDGQIKEALVFQIDTPSSVPCTVWFSRESTIEFTFTIHLFYEKDNKNILK